MDRLIKSAYSKHDAPGADFQRCMNTAHLVGQPVNAVQELRKEPHLVRLELYSPLKHSKQDESGSSSQPGPESRHPGLAHGLMDVIVLLIPSTRRLEDLPRP